MAVGPTIGHAAVKQINAHKVDGKHAIGANSTAAQRAGRLVATDGAGHLPNDIIVKAPEADLLDGKEATAFAPSGHNHDGRYYTKTQLDDDPSSRLVAVGYMQAGGDMIPEMTSGPVTGSRASTGVYNLTVDGLNPGCAGNTPLIITTPTGFVIAAHTNISTSCASGNVTLTITTRNPSLAVVDTTFGFAIYRAP